MIKKLIYEKLALFILLISAPTLLFSQEIQEMEFRGQPLSDVLLSLAEVAGVSIIPDETVTGRVTYRFSDTSFTGALEILSRQFDFFYSFDDNGICHVSRFQTAYNAEKNLITFLSKNVDVHIILQEISKTIGKTVLFDPLPSEKLTLNSENISPEKLIGIILARFPDYEFKADRDYFYISRKEAKNQIADTAGIKGLIRNSENDFSLDTDRTELVKLLEELFKLAEKEYVFLYKSNSVLNNLHYQNKSFDDLLELVLEQSSGGYTVSGGIYYIYELNRQEILKKYKTAVYLPLSHISAKDVPGLLPNTLSSSAYYKLDNAGNGIILSGSLEEISPVAEYIRSIDHPAPGKNYYRYSPDYIEVSKLLELLPSHLLAPVPMVYPETNSFLALLSESSKAELDAIISQIDIPNESHLLKLKYIKAEDFLKTIPPPFASDDFSESGSDSSVYYKGSLAGFDLLNEKLSEVDQPKPQLRYKLLILQTQEGSGLDYELNLSNSVADDSDETSFLGSLGNLLSLDFDLVSTFGYLFALKVNSSLSQSSSRILADTTLHGLSGEPVDFQNTSTYRYTEYEIDDDGDAVLTGVSTEISTGLILKVTGWVSGDGMITMEVESTLSKTGTASSSSDSLPPTSERVVSTHVRTPSGEPIIISGLKQQEKTVTESSPPVIGKIPLLKHIFKSSEESVENTELSIYLIPYIEMNFPEEYGSAVEIKRLFEKFITNQAGTKE